MSRHSRKRYRVRSPHRVAVILTALLVLTFASGAFATDGRGVRDGFSHVGQQDADMATTVGTGAELATDNGPDVDAIRDKVAAYLDQQQGFYGVYFKDLASGAEFSYNGDEVFTAASTYKVPAVFYLYHLAQQGKIDLQEQVAFQRSDWEAGTGVLQATKPGTKFTLQRLAELAITVSDNIALNMIRRRLGPGNIVDFVESLGADVLPEKKNITSPHSMGRILEALYEFAQNYPDYGGAVLGLMERTDTNDRLPAKLPPEVVVAHKVGNWPNAAHDVGIIFAPGHVYILAAMSRDLPTFDYGVKTIAEVSKIVYDGVVGTAGGQ